eukprot:GFKZ01011718.1.p4 GENE.GFKZ01011718.1~~GFKZ01011718.1.p4  ORF type:complete len:117 (+),score=26.12 GFKZ01011718.1:757-1107(+)
MRGVAFEILTADVGGFRFFTDGAVVGDHLVRGEEEGVGGEGGEKRRGFCVGKGEGEGGGVGGGSVGVPGRDGLFVEIGGESGEGEVGEMLREESVAVFGGGAEDQGPGSLGARGHF